MLPVHFLATIFQICSFNDVQTLAVIRSRVSGLPSNWPKNVYLMWTLFYLFLSWYIPYVCLVLLNIFMFVWSHIFVFVLSQQASLCLSCHNKHLYVCLVTTRIFVFVLSQQTSLCLSCHNKNLYVCHVTTRIFVFFLSQQTSFCLSCHNKYLYICLVTINNFVIHLNNYLFSSCCWLPWTL